MRGRWGRFASCSAKLGTSLCNKLLQYVKNLQIVTLKSMKSTAHRQCFLTCPPPHPNPRENFAEFCVMGEHGVTSEGPGIVLPGCRFSSNKQIVFQEQVSLFSLLWAGWECWFQHIFTNFTWLVLESSSARGGVEFKEKIKMPLISGEDVLGRQETCLEQGKIGMCIL